MKWKCLRCGHEWLGRIEKMPKQCPKCKSPYYYKERRQPKEQEVKK